MSARRLPWRGGPPLALQIVALLLGGLVVAQLVTLFLTLILPPAPAPQYGLSDIAVALAKGRGSNDQALERVVQSGPPDISGPGWLISERSRRDLARMMQVDENRVALAFFTPLPFAGAAAARNYAMADDGLAATPVQYLTGAMRPSIVLAQFTAPNGMPIGQLMDRHQTGPLARDAFPPGMFPGTGRPPEGGPRMPAGAVGQALPPMDRGRPLISVDPRFANPQGVFVPGDGGVAVPPLLRGELAAQALAATPITIAPAATTATVPVTGASRAIAAANAITPREFGQFVGAPFLRGPRAALPNASTLMPLIATAPLADAPMRLAPPLTMPEMPAPAPRPSAEAAPRALTRLPEPEAPIIPFAPGQPALGRPAIAPPAPPPEYSAPPSGPPIAIKTPARSLFGLAPAPFVEGDFVAALRLPDGRWSVVRPASEPFPNSWQRRVLLWFAISLALVIPLGWLFARRLVKPLDSFARAAELLGRDPSVEIGPLDGPAEIGRAAHAFNLMQGRLRAFVDDRTAMVGAISHDLRTPLTRMRFRIEDVPDDVREGLLEEVDAMEAMITQVIDYIRDASTPGARERLDLGTLVEEAVEDARLVGGRVTFEHADPAPVEVDVLGLRRVLDNLLENAIKYGDCARIRLRTEAGSAIAEIFDEGPGVPDDEIERAFEPFYRSDAARASEKAGSGLGLAVCRSIARAHGGDVRLRHSGEGFFAEMRVPLAYSAERPLAA